MKLGYKEKVELECLSLKGFKWLVRNEIGSVEVFKIKPHRDKEVNYIPFGKTRRGYDMWIETETPLSREEYLRRRHVEFDEYDFVKWSDEPMSIEELIGQ